MARTLTGNIVCNTNADIEDGAVAEISIINATSADAAALAVKMIENPKFPIAFQIEYDEPSQIGIYCLNVRVIKDENVLFITDTSFPITNRSGHYLDNMDVFVNKEFL